MSDPSLLALASLLLALSVIRCADAGAEGRRDTTDGAGAATIQSAPGGVLRAEIIRGIGAASGDIVFSAISDLAVSPRGSVLISQVGVPAIEERTFAGEWIRRYGRSGGGPGELAWTDQLPRISMIIGDTVLRLESDLTPRLIRRFLREPR